MVGASAHNNLICILHRPPAPIPACILCSYVSGSTLVDVPA